MTRENKFKVGLALNNIACMVCEDDYKKIKSRLIEIEDIVSNEPTEETEDEE